MDSSLIGLPSFDVTSYFPGAAYNDPNNTSNIGSPGYDISAFFQSYGNDPNNTSNIANPGYDMNAFFQSYYYDPESTSLMGLPSYNTNDYMPFPPPQGSVVASSVLGLPSYNTNDYMPFVMPSMSTSMMSFPGYDWGYGGVATSICGYPDYMSGGNASSPAGNYISYNLDDFLGGSTESCQYNSAGGIMQSYLGNTGSFGDGSGFNGMQGNMVASSLFQSASDIINKYLGSGANFGVC